LALRLTVVLFSRIAMRPRLPTTRRDLVLAGLALLLLTFCFRTALRGDGVGYFAYLPSVVVHGTLDMAPTFDRFLSTDTPVWSPNLQHHLSNGMTANYKPVGSALLALPFYLLTHLVMLLVPGYQDPTLGLEYQLAFTGASLFYIVAALVLIYQFIRIRWGPTEGGLAVAAVAFATPLTAYIFFEPSYYHTFAVFIVSAFAIYVYTTHGDRRPRQWFFAGLLGGLATITHVNEIVFLALIPIEAIGLVAERRWSGRMLANYGVFAAGALVGGLPQLVTDKIMFGQWLPMAAPNISFDFLHPHVIEVLFSTQQGWISWTPLVAVGILGLPLVIRRLGWFAVGLVLIGAGEVLLNAALSDWSGGVAFGLRRLTDQSLLLALGFAAVFAWLRKAGAAHWGLAVLGAGIAWNVLLLAQFYYVMRGQAGAPWGQFLTGQLQAVGFVPHLFVQGTAARDVATGHPLEGFAVLIILGMAAAAAVHLTRGRQVARLPHTASTMADA
jgi:Dolichyl-phosphate-mannose-protein mannosyltransferase